MFLNGSVQYCHGQVYLLLWTSVMLGLRPYILTSDSASEKVALFSGVGVTTGRLSLPVMLMRAIEFRR